MKVIDLLNKIAKDEEVPKKIRYNGNLYFYCKSCQIYEISEANKLCGKDLYNTLDNLNDEIEIIEEEKEIEELKIEQVENGTGNFYIRNEYGTKCCLTKHSKIMADKINELVRKLNKIKKEGK